MVSVMCWGHHLLPWSWFPDTLWLPVVTSCNGSCPALVTSGHPGAPDIRYLISHSQAVFPQASLHGVWSHAAIWEVKAKSQWVLNRRMYWAWKTPVLWNLGFLCRNLNPWPLNFTHNGFEFAIIPWALFWTADTLHGHCFPPDSIICWPSFKLSLNFIPLLCYIPWFGQ